MIVHDPACMLDEDCTCGAEAMHQREEAAAERVRLVLSLMPRLQRLGTDELRVVASVVDGLERGHTAYGPLDLTTDGRDWCQETLEEVRDALIYLGCALTGRFPAEPGRWPGT